MQLEGLSEGGKKKECRKREWDTFKGFDQITKTTDKERITTTDMFKATYKGMGGEGGLKKSLTVTWQDRSPT